MKSGDRNYLLLKIMMLNYGADMTFNYEYPKFGKTSGYSLNLQEMLDAGTLKVYPYSEDVRLLSRVGAALLR